MSRSFGARPLTTSSPILSWPSVMSSSPATSRRAVDLPEPDGPTRIMNSPSAMSRFMSFTASKPSPYRLLTCSKTMLDTVVSSLALDGAGGQARDDPALEEQHDQDHWDGDDNRSGGDRADWFGEQ